MPAIETENLTKDYFVGFWRPRPYRALDGLTMMVEEGEVFGFLGPNGAGKSTTLKLLMGLIAPTAGSARILGRPVTDLEVRRNIGFLPENPYFYDYLTAEELLRYYATLSGVNGADVNRRVQAVLDEVGLGAERRMRLRSYSKGMIQRVGVAQAIVAEPSLVFFDEPMSGLDPIGRRDLRQLMLGLRDRGCTVFFSSHILSDAEALCHRVGIIANGKMVVQGQLSDLVAFDLRGWELVVTGLTDTVAAEVRGRVRSLTALSHDRWSLELAPAPPEPFVAELAGKGIRTVSLNPIRTTFEDFFVKAVGTAAPRDTSGLA
jgi:ABC-2 type transport system ATP-binding protein